MSQIHVLLSWPKRLLVHGLMNGAVLVRGWGSEELLEILQMPVINAAVLEKVGLMNGTSTWVPCQTVLQLPI